MDELRPLYDSLEEDFPLWETYYQSPRVERQLASLDWGSLMENPISIPLPCVISFEPKKGSKTVFPCGCLWGILMDFEYYGAGKRPKADGTVYICGDQSRYPPINDWLLLDLYEWALDEKNCPIEFRFRSLQQALRTLCLGEHAKFPCESTRKDNYFSGLRSWKSVEWDRTLERLVRDGVDFIQTQEIPSWIKPKKTKQTRKKRKKPDVKDADEFPENLIIPDLNLPDIFSRANV